MHVIPIGADCPASELPVKELRPHNVHRIAPAKIDTATCSSEKPIVVRGLFGETLCVIRNQETGEMLALASAKPPAFDALPEAFMRAGGNKEVLLVNGTYVAPGHQAWDDWARTLTHPLILVGHINVDTDKAAWSAVVRPGLGGELCITRKNEVLVYDGQKIFSGKPDQEAAKVAKAELDRQGAAVASKLGQFESKAPPLAAAAAAAGPAPGQSDADLLWARCKSDGKGVCVIDLSKDPVGMRIDLSSVDTWTPKPKAVSITLPSDGIQRKVWEPSNTPVTYNGKSKVAAKVLTSTTQAADALQALLVEGHLDMSELGNRCIEMMRPHVCDVLRRRKLLPVQVTFPAKFVPPLDEDQLNRLEEGRRNLGR